MKCHILNTTWNCTWIISEHRELFYNLNFPRNRTINFLQQWMRNSIDAVQGFQWSDVNICFCFLFWRTEIVSATIQRTFIDAPTVTLWLTHSCKPPNPHPHLRCCFCMLLSLLSIKQGKERGKCYSNERTVRICVHCTLQMQPSSVEIIHLKVLRKE